MPSTAETYRVFFALVPPPETRAALVGIQGRLDVHGKAVPAGNLHVTLAFLGEVSKDRVQELTAVASDLSLPAQAMMLDRVGCFPRAGVLFLAPELPDPRLSDFQQRLVDGLHGAGFSPDRKPWRPHVTLYRNLRKPCPRMAIEPLAWRIREFCLVRSHLQKDGAKYQAIARWKAVNRG